MPMNSAAVLKINPWVGLIELIGNLSTQGYKWAGGVLSQTGIIYGIPHND